MTRQMAIFHSVLGVRPGILDAAARLRAAGYDVRVIDQYDGRVFDDYAQAIAFAEDIGYPRLMESALEATADLDDGFCCVGFSNGGGMSEYVALRRRVSGVVLCSGTLPLPLLASVFPPEWEVSSDWPAHTPVQMHYAQDDPYRIPGAVEDFMQTVQHSGAAASFWEYPGAGHLFADPSLPGEFDETSAALLWERVLRFLNELSAGA